MVAELGDRGEDHVTHFTGVRWFDPQQVVVLMQKTVHLLLDVTMGSEGRDEAELSTCRGIADEAILANCQSENMLWSRQ